MSDPGRQVVDMTGIEGNYDASMDIPLTEILAMARAAGLDIPGAPPPGANQGNTLPADPGARGNIRSRSCSGDVISL